MPGSQKDEWDCSSLFETELVRNRKNICSRNSNVFGISALCLVPDDLVRFAKTVPTIAAVITDSTAYAGGDQDFLAFRCPLTWLPVSAISPEMSEPDMCGRGILSLLVPPLAQMSRWFSAHALTLTRTSFGLIFGSGASSNRSFSGPPNSWNRTAFNLAQFFLQEPVF